MHLEVSDGTDTATLTRSRNGWIVEVDAPAGDRERMVRMLEAATESVARDGGGRLEFWIEAVDAASDAIPLAAGFTPYRDLWQLRCTLPAEPSGLDTRPFADADAEAFLAVNNRAFHWHPEQGGMTIEALAEKQAEDWYDADGFRLLEIEGRLAGFCWTKVHRDTTPNLGEIYAIAVDPDFHGQGLGGPMTLAGLEWLSAAGLDIGMLYVESDNRPANATYKRIGFDHYATNRAYERTVR